MSFLKKLVKDPTTLISPLLSGIKNSGGKTTGNHGDAAQAQGMKEFFDAIKDFEATGNNQYSWLNDLANPPQLGDTEMDGITLDPKLKGYEMSALADLEQISKDGLSARDQADLAQLESQVNRQNAGRTGAIQQNMAARGMGGSGLEMVQQMQANQDATERQALASLEKAAMAQDGRRNATAQLGAQAGQMSARDFQQQAQRAQAQDAINRFNVANQYQTQQYNHQGQQGIANQNVQQNNQFAADKMQAKQGGAQMKYNSGTEATNQAAMRKKAKQDNDLAWAGMGVEIGKTAAKAAGAGGKYDGGLIPGQAQVPGDHPANDTVPTMLSPGEVVIPRTIAQQIPGEDPVEAIAKLLARVRR